MNIHEYQAKQILNRYGINIPKGGIAYTPSEAKRVAQKVSPRGPWMLKAQIQTGARADGKFKEKEVTFAPYYQTDKDDYNTCKVLKIGGKK